MNIEKFLKDKNIVRNKKQANIIMVSIILLCLLFIIISNRKMFTDSNSGQELSEKELMELGENI